MTITEILVVTAAGAVMASAAYASWAGIAARAEASADLDEVLAVAAEYRRRNCTALPLARTRVQTLAAGIGWTLGVEEPAAWTVQYRAAAGTGSRQGGTTMDVAYTSALERGRYAVLARGGRAAGPNRVVLTVAPARAGEHRGRRALAWLQDMSLC